MIPLQLNWGVIQHHIPLRRKMRFLTPDWHRGILTDEEAESVEAAFSAHQHAFAASVTGALRELAIGPSLHDARIVSVSVARPAHAVVLRLRAGDQQRGYFDRTVTYEGVELKTLDVATLATIARDPASELLADEIDLAESGRYSHSLLFWPHYREIVIEFTSARISDTLQSDRTLRTSADRYSDSNAPAV